MTRNASAASISGASTPATAHTEPAESAPTRTRADGWTVARQRSFVEALADCGSVRAACARVGMSAQSAYALRRRSDARAFRQAWDAARAMAAQVLEEGKHPAKAAGAMTLR